MPTPNPPDEVARDAARYRWLKATLERAVGGTLDVNEPRLVYEEPEAGKEVQLCWYPETPIGSHLLHGHTLDEVVDYGLAIFPHREVG